MKKFNDIIRTEVSRDEILLLAINPGPDCPNSDGDPEDLFRIYIDWWDNPL